MNPNDERDGLLLLLERGNARQRARAEEALRARYPAALASPEQQAAEEAEAALVAADANLYRVEDAHAGALLGDDPDLISRLASDLVAAQAASAAAAEAHNAAQATLTTLNPQRNPR